MNKNTVPDPLAWSARKGKCDNCGKKRKLTAWVGEGGMLDLVHGAYSMWCEECQWRAQLRYAEGLAKNIPSLKRKLKKYE